MKKNRIILLIIDFIALCFIVFIFISWHKKQYSNTNQNITDYNISEVSDSVGIIFKKFTFNIPNSIEYTLVDEYKFKLSSDNYTATVDIIAHNDNNMLKYPDLFYDMLRDNNINASKPIKDKMGIIDIVKYDITNDDGEKTTLYYFKYNDSFDYEVELDGDEEHLGEIMNILLNADYDSESTEKYAYHVWNFTD